MPNKDVNFPSRGLRIAGRLYTPDNGGAPAPAVVVGHPTTGVKEQCAGTYAQQLADRGFVALAFDAAYQGESEGQPHFLEDPSQRTEDFRAAVSYLTTLPEVDADRIGVVGICGSGGYVVNAAQGDRRAKAVATVSAADVPRFIENGDEATFSSLIDAAGQARNDEAAGKEAALLDLLPAEVGADTPAATAEFIDYYKTPRAQHPRSTNQIATRSIDELANFHAFADVAMIAPRPLLMIAGTEAVTLPVSQDAVSRAGENAELFEVEGATHVDLYDREPYVDKAYDKLAEFFGKNL